MDFASADGGRVACVGIYVVDAIAKPIDRVPETGTL